MDWDRIAENWQHFKGNARRHWVRLTDDQLDLVAGRRERLACQIQEAYGISGEKAEKQLAAWQAAQKENSPFR